MKIFYCDACGNLVFFENVQCVKCGHAMGYLPLPGDLSALEPTKPGVWKALSPGTNGALYRQCANGRQHEVCNWMVPVDDPNPFCPACALNLMVPDLKLPGNLERWQKLEQAKRRMIYTLNRLRLPMAGGGAAEKNRPALRFQFLGDPAGGPPVLSGHLNGVITVNIAEADDAERERRRVSLHEPYRTLLGHLRHEVAHYYWDRLIADSPRLAEFRKLFGDETRDYAGALKTHYEQGPPADWQSRHVSAYASAHPWEDWAETGAHYFHIVDTVETAGSFGMVLRPRHPSAQTMTANPKNVNAFDANFDTFLENWFPLTYALNSLNRSMGLLDLYPFALSSQAIEKLRFVHRVFHDSTASAWQPVEKPAR